MKKFFPWKREGCVLLALPLWAGLFSPPLALARPPDRIHEQLEDGRTFAVNGNTHPLAAGTVDLGETDGSLLLSHITIHFKMSASQESQLNALLRRQQDRSTSDYHKWLTPEQYADRFGISSSDANKVVAWLEGQGFSEVTLNRSRTAVSMSATASLVSSALQTSIHRYEARGAVHYANTSDPVLPKALQGIVAGVRGLHDFRPRPHGISSRLVRGQPRFTSSLSGNHFMTPDDFATIYDVKPLYQSGIDGTGQTIVIAGQSDIALTDIAAFRAAAGLPTNAPQVMLVPGSKDPGTVSGDEEEADLDIEWGGGIARQATIIYVNSDSAFNSAIYAIDQNLAPVLSMSYGLCEPQMASSDVKVMESALQQANAEGITVLVASGDSGAADCENSTDTTTTLSTVATTGLAVDYPASSAYATGMGGTSFTEGADTAGQYWSQATTPGTALSYIPETTWNDTSGGQPLAASGGGVSTLFAKPSWQAGTGVPADQWRHVPDVAVNASPGHDGYLVCTGGQCVTGFRDSQSNLDVRGGTSIGAPTFAGIVALLNQQTGSRQGNINQTLYSLASTSRDAFHDTTTGNNQVPCKAASTGCPASGVLGYSAGTGYDQVTGLGSIDAAKLIGDWSSEFQIAATPATLTIGKGATGTVTVTVTPVGNFNASVTFTCSVAGLSNTTCSIPGSVTKGGTATLTITAGSNARTGFWFRRFDSGSLGKNGLLVAAFMLILLSALRLTRGRKRLWVTGMAGVSLLLMTSCGDGGSASSTAQSIQQSGTITITGTSGIENHTATVTVTVP